ncbi:MAG TPA: hemerythrin domain-containing protein [Kofleriaceae bacterium]|jgi:hemerythrin superfamily protein|nr:hemerythrin domain-containing protein [Kofleriaceae bacterium]
MRNRMAHAVAKTKGVMKGIKARIDGLTGVFETLSKQHGEAMALLDAIKKDPEKRTQLWPQARTALLAHERAEMRVLYPELRMYDELRPLANQHDAEATELERMIHDLESIEVASDTWGKLLDRLAENIARHANEEETDIFPRAQDSLGVARVKQLDAKLGAAYDALLEAQ